jgi:2-methylisocitrate lyase-like PEP mutase family enzyme
MATQASKAAAFKALHERGTFIIPNPWDAGTARALTAMGFQALATTSAGHAFTLGRPDGGVTREETLANARAIVEASELPVSADLENGFGDDPASCAETIRRAASVGLVGGSIEDAARLAKNPIYPLDHAIERVKAAVAAARSLAFPFVLVARAENYLHGRPDLADTIRRLQAFAAAGADVLYAPGLKARADVAAVVEAVAPKPVNVIMGIAGMTLSRDDLAALGVRRISVGSTLARAAWGAFMRGAEELKSKGTCDYVAGAVPSVTMNGMFTR